MVLLKTAKKRGGQCASFLQYRFEYLYPLFQGSKVKSHWDVLTRVSNADLCKFWFNFLSSGHN